MMHVLILYMQLFCLLLFPVCVMCCTRCRFPSLCVAKVGKLRSHPQAQPWRCLWAHRWRHLCFKVCVAWRLCFKKIVVTISCLYALLLFVVVNIVVVIVVIFLNIYQAFVKLCACIHFLFQYFNDQTQYGYFSFTHISTIEAA